MVSCFAATRKGRSVATSCARAISKGIIGLPANLFYGTGIPACIVVIDKEDAQVRKGIFMIDASLGFMKDGPKNRLRSQDIHKIVDAFTRHLDIPGYSRMVPFDEIEKHEFNLNLPRYIDSQKREDRQDIEGHLRGGIPMADIDALSDYWQVCPSLKKSLFKKSRPGYVELAIEKGHIKSTIFGHQEFTSFIDGMNAHFKVWRDRSEATLKLLKLGHHPKEVIFELSEDLLSHYADEPLIGKYDVYQHLMDYWIEVMQDDCYLIAADGWKAETYRIVEKDKKGKERDRGWACDLVPKSLIVPRYFATEQKAIDDMSNEMEAASMILAEMEEEQAGEDGFFADSEKINKASVGARVKEIKSDKEAREEMGVLSEWLRLAELEADLKKKIKEAEAALDVAAYQKYPSLSVAEIKTLVVDDKWLAAIDARIHGEMDRISQALAQRVRMLAERYEVGLSDLVANIVQREAKVDEHLKRMGFSF